MSKSEIREQIKDMGFYLWAEEKKREPRKDCVEEKCPKYHEAGYSVHCKTNDYRAGWCLSHLKDDGKPHDKKLIKVEDVLGLLDGCVIVDCVKLLEPLAELEHVQWSHWVTYEHSRNLYINRKEELAKWIRQSETAYEKLTEREKHSDREWARKVIEKIVELTQQ